MELSDCRALHPVRRERAVEALRLFAQLLAAQRAALRSRRETLRVACLKMEEADAGRAAVEARLAGWFRGTTTRPTLKLLFLNPKPSTQYALKACGGAPGSGDPENNYTTDVEYPPPSPPPPSSLSV